MLDRVIKEGASDKGKFTYMIRVEEIIDFLFLGSKITADVTAAMK